MKLKLIDFMNAMIEGENREVLLYVITNFELKNLEKVMVDSLCQLYNNSKYESNSVNIINDFKMGMKDYTYLIKLFNNNKNFSEHPLMNICFEIFNFINKIASR